MLQKIPNLCLENDRVSEAIKGLAMDFGKTTEFFHVTIKIPSLCSKHDRISEPRKNGRRFWTD